MVQLDEFVYVVLILGLFVVPRILERLFIPSGITAFFLGIILTTGFGYFHGDMAIALLAALGINSLFLFAGVEANLEEIRANIRTILTHVVSHGLVLTLLSFAVHRFLELSVVTSILYSLALVTPSTGFILDSIHTLPIDDEKKFWVKAKAIATELLALVLMFVLLQAHSLVALSLSTLGLAVIIMGIPLIFRLVARTITPYAENSEFGFFLALAVMAGILTKKLGAYYLVGAFIIGLSVQRFQSLFPKMDSEKLLHSLKLFSAFFVPFYFFKAGGKLSFEHFSFSAIGLGIVLVLFVTGIRVLSTTLSRRISFKEGFWESLPVGMALIPTLIFGLVIADILREKYELAPTYFGGLIVYTLIVSIVPGIFLRNRRIQDVAEPFEILDVR